MTGFVLIDAALGVMLALLVYSLIASAVQEAIAGALNLRGGMLVEALHNFFLGPNGERGGTAVVDALLDHPLIRPLKGRWPLMSARTRAPSAIPAHLFARAMVETLEGKAGRRVSEADLSAFLGSLPVDGAVTDKIKDAFRTGSPEALESAVAGLGATLEDAIARTYDAIMERVRGWYVRRVQAILLVIGFCLAAATNFDVLGYGVRLLEDEGARAAAVARAEMIAGSETLGQEIVRLALQAGKETNDPAAAMAAILDTLNGEIAAQGLPVGWDCRDAAGKPAGFSVACMAEDAPRNVLAWLIVAFGCMLGAQFWFDALKGLLSMRTDLAGMLGGTRAPENTGENTGAPPSPPRTG